MDRRPIASTLLGLLVATLGCTVEPAGKAEADPIVANTAAPPAEADPPANGEPSPPTAPRFVAAPPGPADEVIRAAAAAGAHEGYRLLVYTGATWCEPCVEFHHAVERGELDQALAGVRLLEFDADHDGARLAAAGYSGRYIPRFVLPDAEGRGSDRRIEGGIKGPGAVGHIMARLGPLLAEGDDR